MGLARRIVHLIWGRDLDAALRPVLVLTFAGMVASSTGFTFLGVWAIRGLGASARELSVGFLAAAAAAAGAGYVGGHLSDRFGRRRLILVGEGAATVVPLCFLAAGHHVVLGLGVMVMWAALRSLSGSASTAMVADLVPRDRQEEAYAAARVASNLGVAMGPPIGAVLLLAGGWHVFFPGVAVLSLAARAVAWRLLPVRGQFAPEAPPDRGSFRVIARDRLFLLLLLANTFAQLVYVAYETVLPVSLVSSHGLEAWQWGALAMVNPLVVGVAQMRLTRRLAAISTAAKFAAAMVLMGFPFLLLAASSAIPVILLVLVLFVIGEMLWVPTTQGLVAARAPADLRGAYMGAFGSTSAVGFAMAPFLGLQVRAAAGDLAMWAFFAGLASAGAVIGVATCGAIARDSAPRRVVERAA